MRKKIGIVGIGKLGLCFAVNLEQVGFEVLGLDVNQDYVDQVNQKKIDTHEPQLADLLARTENFSATTDYQKLSAFDPEIIFLIVATPSLPEGGYDHYQLEEVFSELEKLGPVKERKELVVVATTLPGYCDSIAERLKNLGYALSYNPEFIAQGTIIRDQQEPDQVLIGEADETAGNRIEAVYRELVKNEPTFCRMDRLSAEICKLATNCFLTTKISFANSIGDLALQTGADPQKILSAIGSDSRIGKKYLGYGFGYGGPCFPRDNRALNKFATDQGYPLLISEATDQVNQRHLDFQLKQWLKNIPESQSIIFETVTYKKDSVLLEESQQLALAEQLARAGRKVVIQEREVVITELRSRFGDLFTYEKLS